MDRTESEFLTIQEVADALHINYKTAIPRFENYDGVIDVATEARVRSGSIGCSPLSGNICKRLLRPLLIKLGIPETGRIQHAFLAFAGDSASQERHTGGPAEIMDRPFFFANNRSVLTLTRSLNTDA